MPIPALANEGKPGSGMHQPPAHDTSTNLASFWRSYVHIGVLTYSMGALAVVV